MSIVLSIKPQFTNLILNGQKAIEMRTKIGKEFVSSAKVIIYSSSPIKAIVAIAKIETIQHINKREVTDYHLEKVCISKKNFDEYMQNRENCFLIKLSKVQKLKNPISLAELRKLDFTVPQSFCYASKELISLVNSSL